jgi:hypothetical protein
LGALLGDCGALNALRLRHAVALRVVDAEPAHRSMSMPNTRFSRRAQVMATCRGVGLSAVPARLRAPGPRPAGVTAARNAACGANTP